MKKWVFFCLFLWLVFYCAFASASPDGKVEVKPSESDLTKAYAYYASGILHDNRGNLKNATEEYKKALRYDYGASAIHLHLSYDYIKLGQYEDAIKQLNTAIKVCSKDTGPRFLLALLYVSLERFDEATREYEKILASNPNDLLALSSLADLYVLQGKLKEAIKAYAKISDYENISPFVLFNMGLLYNKLGNFKATQYYLKKAIIKYEKNVAQGEMIEEAHIAHFYLATVYDNNLKRGEAKKHLRRAIYLDPDEPEALNYLGYMYADDNEKLDYAVYLIKRALEIQPDEAAYLDSLGWAYFKKGMLQEALANLQKANELMPDPVISEHLQKVKEKIPNSKFQITNYK